MATTRALCTEATANAEAEIAVKAEGNTDAGNDTIAEVKITAEAERETDAGSDINAEADKLHHGVIEELSATTFTGNN